ncbi:C1 family peptidase [bacterium]|nr:C1 family peptidase [bacterium]
MKRVLSVLTVLVVLISWFAVKGFAADAHEGLTPELIKELEGSFELNPQTRALINAVSNNDLKVLSFDREFHSRHDDLFSSKIETKGITNQKSSGRCWLFAGFNMMRPAVMKKYNLSEFEFSENYLFFWDKLEKANTFLEAVIETRDRDIDDRELQTLLKDPVPDGGWWNYVVNLIEKYGTVPKSVMPETKNTSSTGRMNKQLNRVVRSFAAQIREAASEGASEAELRAGKVEMLKKVYRLLVLNMGIPPEEFTWRVEDKDEKIFEKNYTPLSFYKEAVKVDLKDYICLLDHPGYEYNKLYRIRFCRNMSDLSDMEFINVEIDKLREYALKAVLNDEPVWFAADVGKANDTKNGILASGAYDVASLLGTKALMTKAQRVLYRESIPSHAMVFIGVDLSDDNTPEKWLVENSWGKDTGNNGLWTMYDEWFDKYVFSVIVRRSHVPKDVLKILKTEPEILPAWDPMRGAFN